MLVDLVCEQCGKPFQRSSYDVERGRGKYCGRSCSGLAHVGHPAYNAIQPQERICPTCGDSFLVGGRGRRGYRAQFCSNACRNAAHYLACKVASPLSQTDAAYLAGLIDGEGSIFLAAGREERGIALRLTISNTHRGVLDWTCATTGVGNVLRIRAATERHKGGNFWKTHGDAAESVLRQTLPYMHIKADQARMAIAFQERLRTPSLKADRSWQDEYRERMQAMNRRGPKSAETTIATTLNAGG